jgi:hypothetical protein
MAYKSEYTKLVEQLVLGKKIDQLVLRGKTYKFSDKQSEFISDMNGGVHKFILASGGRGSGKSLALCVKMYLMCKGFPGIRILLGRKNLSDIDKTTLQDLFRLMPPNDYEHRVKDGLINFRNGSQIVLLGLDAMQSGNIGDMKKAQQKTKSMNIGAYFIDQLEEIEYEVFQALNDTMRMVSPEMAEFLSTAPQHLKDAANQMDTTEVLKYFDILDYPRQGNMTTNPANFWAYHYFKLNERMNEDGHWIPKQATHFTLTKTDKHQVTFNDGKTSLIELKSIETVLSKDWIESNLKINNLHTAVEDYFDDLRMGKIPLPPDMNFRQGFESYYLETSMLDNKDNLPPDFLKDRLNREESYVRRMVYGEWNLDVLLKGSVFSKENIRYLESLVRPPLYVKEGCEIFEEPGNLEYRMGIDPSEGVVDPSSISVVSFQGRKVAKWNGMIPIQGLADKVKFLYYKYNKPLIVVESNSGAGLIREIRDLRLYRRKMLDEKYDKDTEKLGFRMSWESKAQLIEHFQNLLRNKAVKIYDRKTVEEMKTFLWSDEATQSGAGASRGFHDDDIISTLLAFWDFSPKKAEEIIVQRTRQVNKRTFQYS